MNPRNAEIVRLRKEGVGPREIARRLNLSRNVVAGIVRRAGLAEPGRLRVRPESRAADVAKACGMRAVGRTYDEIAQALDVSLTTVWFWVNGPTSEAA